MAEKKSQDILDLSDIEKRPVLDMFGDAGKRLGNVAVGIAGRDVNHTVVQGIGEHVKPHIINAVNSLLNYASERQVPIISGSHDADKIAQFIITGLAVGIEPAIRFSGSLKDDWQQRQVINEQLAPLRQFGVHASIRASSAMPALGRSDNRVIAALEDRASALWANQAMAGAGAALIASTTIAASRQVDKATYHKELEENIADVSSKIETEQTKTPNNQSRLQSLNKEQEQLQKTLDAGGTRSAMGPVTNLLGMSIGNVGAITPAAVVTAGGAFFSDYIMGKAKENVATLNQSVLAYDLIMHLDQAVRDGKVEHGKIPLGKFGKMLKQEGSRDVTVAEFIELIFQQHVRDQGGEGIAGGSARERLKETCKRLADSITGKEFDPVSGATLHPLALIDIVGTGHLVSHDGYSVAGENIVQQTIHNARQQCPYEARVNPNAYLLEMGVHPGDFSNLLNKRLSDTSPQAAEYLAFLLPREVLSEVAGWSEDKIRTTKSAVYDHALETTQMVVRDIAAQSDDALREANFTKAQIKLLRRAEAYVRDDNPDALLTMMRDRSVDGLGFVLARDTQYWTDIAEGKYAMGEPGKAAQEVAAEKEQEKAACEAKKATEEKAATPAETQDKATKKEASTPDPWEEAEPEAEAKAANIVTPLKRASDKEPTNDNHEPKASPDSKIEQNAQHDGRTTEKVLAKAH